MPVKKVAAVLLILAVLLSAVLLTQGLAVPMPGSVGFKLGRNYADFADGTSWISYDARSANAVGLYVVYPISDRFSLQTELLRTTKGPSWGGSAFRTTESGYCDTIDIRGRYELRYTEIPVLIRFDLCRIGTGRLFFLTGPGIAYNTKATNVCEVCWLPGERDISVRRIDPSIITGCGFVLIDDGYEVSLEFRYERGPDRRV